MGAGLRAVVLITVLALLSTLACLHTNPAGAAPFLTTRGTLRKQENNNTSNNDESSSTPSLPWTNETADELLQAAVAKYLPKSDDEVSLYSDGIGLGAVLEMEDPMGGRFFWCLRKYYRLWRDSPSNLPREPLFEAFFEWLDFGGGHDTDIQHCSTAQYSSRRYRKFTAAERAEFEVDFDVGKGRIGNVRRHDNGMHFKPGTWLLVWGPDQKLYLLEEGGDASQGWMGHATIFCGRPVLLAGELGISERGYVEWVSDESGHYHPNRRHMHNFLLWLEKWGVNASTIVWKEYVYSEEYEGLVELAEDWFKNETNENESKTWIAIPPRERLRTHPSLVGKLTTTVRRATIPP